MGSTLFGGPLWGGAGGGIPPVYFPQINSYGMMTERPYSSGFSFNTVVQKLDNARPYTFAKRGGGLNNFPLGPLGKFVANFPSVSTAELATLSAFFDTCLGRFNSFIFLDPGGNLINNSENFSASSWSGASVGATGVTDPFGGTRASTVSGSIDTIVIPLGNLPANFILCVSIWCRALSGGQSMTLGFQGLQTQTWALPANSWQRVYFGYQVNTSAPIVATFVPSSSMQVFGPQCAPLMGPGGYRKTPDAWGYHLNCRFDTDSFTWKANGPNDNAVTLPIAEFFTT